MFDRQLDQPEVHDLMRELRAVVDAYPDRVLIGETDQVAYYGSGSDELHLVFNVGLMQDAIADARMGSRQPGRAMGRHPRGVVGCDHAREPR